ncbi:permease [Vallitalea pronyensis]|uniref:Permease n=1 Tax=Vallitalea pronyensis TaxID=1348613 RepID=A0A8J8SH23_9FIRM|nr:permease [Vallitalea pronyensis]QUI23410.1 permease [Vallitalea pronyensis]
MEKDKKKKPIVLFVFLGTYTIFIVLSMIISYEPGKVIFDNFYLFIMDMFKLFPPAFILVGLFMVWIDRKVVEKYFGESSGLKGYISAILLACTTLYPFVVVLPMASGLYKKGAKLDIVLTYLGASAICRIPMSIFEATFLGFKFTAIRYIVSLPLIVFSSVIIGKLMKNKQLSFE